MHSTQPHNKPFAARCAARLARRPRLTGWAIATLLLALLVWLIAPQQLPVSLYKLSLVTLAGVVGYWLDRSMFPYARPDRFLPATEIDDTFRVGDDQVECAIELSLDLDAKLVQLAGMAMLRRAVIVAATMLAVGLGA